MDWVYTIQGYRKNDDFSLSPVPDQQAELWMGLRERGEDRRCFGLFPTRQDAERATELLKSQKLDTDMTRGRGRQM